MQPVMRPPPRPPDPLGANVNEEIGPNLDFEENSPQGNNNRNIQKPR